MAPAARSLAATPASRGTVAPSNANDPAVRVSQLSSNLRVSYRTCIAHLVHGSDVVLYQHIKNALPFLTMSGSYFDQNRKSMERASVCELASNLEEMFYTL